MKVEMFSLFDSTLIHTQEVIRLAAAMLEGKQKKRGFLYWIGTEKTPRTLLDSKARFSAFNAIKNTHIYTRKSSYCSQSIFYSNPISSDSHPVPV